MRGQVWVEFTLGAMIFIFAFAYLYTQPFAESAKSLRTVLAYLAAEQEVALQELNAGEDLYIASFTTNPDATEINVSGNYDSSALRKAILAAVSRLGVVTVRT